MNKRILLTVVVLFAISASSFSSRAVAADAPAVAADDLPKALLQGLNETVAKLKESFDSLNKSKPSTDADSGKSDLFETKTTEHELKIGSQKLDYRASAGKLKMLDDAGKQRADMFFVAYEKLPVDDLSRRPITFVFNGGPGAAAIWLHLGTAGPRRVDLNPDGSVSQPPHHVVDNEFTWLDSTDLVFVDPVGTGFSRLSSDEHGKEFYGVEQDIAAMAEFIRHYTTRFNRWQSPKFLAGESYGTTRAAALSEYLLDKTGISLNGIIFISTVFNFQTISFGVDTDLPYPLYLPSYTATAWYHKKLPEDLQADLNKTLDTVRQWSIDTYMPALAIGDSLPKEQREEIEEQLSRFSGLSIETIRKSNMRVDIEWFRTNLLADTRQTLGRFDSRMTGYDHDLTSRSAEFDPSLSMYLAAYTGAFNGYVRNELKFESDLSYDALSGRVGKWDFGDSGNGYLYVANRLRNAMLKNPNMKLMFASGYYDLATPFFGTQYTINHLNVGPLLHTNITHSYFQGGHMMYHNLADLQKLDAEIEKFITEAKAEKIIYSPAIASP